MTTKPTRIGKYEIVEELGRGGFATVYKARDVELERVVALKVLHPYYAEDKQFVERFRQEARAAARLRHPHIVTVYEAGEAGDQLYIAMEYLPGRALQALLETEGALSLERALPILEQVAEALDHAHAQGMVHRDVKPGNVMVEETAGGARATLTDFGLVKALAASTVLTSAGTLLGSLEYMAPEQAEPERAGEVGPAADRYALGVVAYQMLTGRVPFPGNTTATLYAHEHKPVPPPRSLCSGLSEAVEGALLRVLAKAPAERFPSACAFVAQLREALLAGQQAARLAPLYAQLQAAAGRQEWAEVLALGSRIEELAPAYRDVQKWMGRARHRLRRPLRRPPRERPASQWPVVGGVAAFLVVIGIAAIVVPRLTETVLSPTITPRPNEMPTWTPAPPTATPRPTEMPTPMGPPAEANIGDTWTRPTDGMVMVYVPAGDFLMGSSDADSQAYDYEKPQHTVYLDAFWIDRTEVTNAQYRKCVDAGACREPGGWDENDYNAPDQPVVYVYWDDARAYAAWAGGRLPTEAEWEKAARGTDGRIYPWGNRAPDCDKANYAGCVGRPATVGSYLTGVSPYGVLDMAGNVWNWVADWFDTEYYDRSPARNPQGPASGEDRVVRGGAFSLVVEGIRSGYRGWCDPYDRFRDIGFRLVMSPVARLTSTPAPPTATPRPTEMPTPVGPPAEANIGDTWTSPKDGMVMVYVPAGQFLMGSRDTPSQADNPQHTAYLDAYWIDRTEVTNAQYRKCVEAGVCQQPGCWDNENANAPDQPVVCVTWAEAQAYAAWVGGRLPTEAEWEKAARGTDGRIYPWGDKFDGTRLNYCDRNCELNVKDTSADDGYAVAAPVGSYLSGASPYGALDMAGNVWEWVADWYDEEYYDRSPARNPQGPDTGVLRVLRGGCFLDVDWIVQCAARYEDSPYRRDEYIGFRAVAVPAGL